MNVYIMRKKAEEGCLSQRTGRDMFIAGLALVVVFLLAL